MESFTKLTAVAVPLDMANVNTDQIFPARFIKKPRATGYAQFAFHDVRRDDDGTPRDDFLLNQQRFAQAQILVADANFGCGSSREGAVYTLQDSGFRAVIAPSFGDIFAANCLKNGVLTVTLPVEMAAELRDELHEANDPSLTIDLEGETIRRPGGGMISFSADPFQKYCLMNGLNEIDLSLEFADRMADFEARHRERFPWLGPSPEETA
jgi:3-isopropylmalate/(R)-2-methylmalate dehydratase small subunit